MEGALVCIIRQLEDRAPAVVVVRARGEPSFRDAVVHVVDLKGVSEIYGGCYEVDCC